MGQFFCRSYPVCTIDFDGYPTTPLIVTSLLGQVVRRPYVFLYRDAKDSVERSLINLARSQIEYSDEDPHDTPNSFRLVTEIPTHWFFLGPSNECNRSESINAVHLMLINHLFLMSHS